MSFSAFLIASLTFGRDIISLFLTIELTNICGVNLKTLNKTLAFFFFRSENKNYRATSKPSPVVANFPSIMWPDCSPPKL
jgi:hypothetical protein